MRARSVVNSLMFITMILSHGRVKLSYILDTDEYFFINISTSNVLLELLLKDILQLINYFRDDN